MLSPFGSMSGQTTGATVVRLNREAPKGGLRSFESAGLRVASSRDFTGAAAPPDFDGADMIVFERFGIAIVDAGPDRMAAAMAQKDGRTAILSQRPERIFRAIGMQFADIAPIGTGLADSTNGLAAPSAYARDYLIGYLGGVQATVAHLLNGDGAAAPTLEPEFLRRRRGGTSIVDETAATWGLQAVNVLSSRFTGKGIKVAILDTGIDFDHPDFVGRQIVSRSFVPGQDVQDGQGHGTHCAGTACGPVKPAGVPRYGIASDALLHVGKVLSNSGSGSDRSVMGGLQWALDSGCDVISMSLGSAAGVDEPFVEDYELIGQNALESGSIVICAAGNESDRPSFVAPVGSPANCPSMFAVAAVDQALRVAPFSCGKRTRLEGGEVDLAAPGVDVFSSVPGPRHYARFPGTSMAAPHVAGVAALLAESSKHLRGMALWGALIQGRRFIPGDVADIGAGLVSAPR